MFVRNKSILKLFLTSNQCVWLKYMSSTTVLLSPVKNYLIWIRREICTALFTSKKNNNLKFIKCLDEFITNKIEWSVVDYCDVFIGCLDSHSDGTHSLQMIHWWASNVMLNLPKSILMKKQTWMGWGLLNLNVLNERFLSMVCAFNLKMSEYCQNNCSGWYIGPSLLQARIQASSCIEWH